MRDPASSFATDNGAILYFARQYNRVIDQLHAVLEMEPGFYRAYIVVSAEVQVGKFADALADVQKWHRNGLSGQGEWAMQAYVYGKWGKQAEARAPFGEVTTICTTLP